MKLNKQEKAHVTAQKFSDERDVIIFNGSCYKFAGDIWNSLERELLESRIRDVYIKEFDFPNIQIIKEVIKNIKLNTWNAYEEQLLNINEMKTINLKSGVFDPITKEVRPYEKEDLAFYKLPFDYTEEINCPQFKNFLTSIMGYDLSKGAGEYSAEQMEEYKRTIHFIQEWMGYSLMPGNKFQRSLMMVGKGRNGKGVLQEIWTKMLGMQNVSFLDIKQLNHDGYVQMAKDKLINFSSDISSGQQLDTGTMKRITVGEVIIANPKYKDQVQFNFTAKIVILCNELPYVKTVGDAIRERFFILPFNRFYSEEERDPYLIDKLSEELEGIFSFAVKGLTRLMERGHFIAPKRCKNALNDYMYANDSIAQWIEENGMADKIESCKRSHAYKNYNEYCKDSGQLPLGKQKAFQAMTEAGFKIERVNNEYFFIGMRDVNNIF